MIITIIKREELPNSYRAKIFADCFYKSNLKIGDYVLFFATHKEMYCIPGKESILKISDY